MDVTIDDSVVAASITSQPPPKRLRRLPSHYVKGSTERHRLMVEQQEACVKLVKAAPPEVIQGRIAKAFGITQGEFSSMIHGTRKSVIRASVRDQILGTVATQAATDAFFASLPPPPPRRTRATGTPSLRKRTRNQPDHEIDRRREVMVSFRKRWNLSRAELGRLLGINNSVVSLMLEGKRLIGDKFLELMEYFDGDMNKCVLNYRTGNDIPNIKTLQAIGLTTEDIKALPHPLHHGVALTDYPSEAVAALLKDANAADKKVFLDTIFAAEELQRKGIITHEEQDRFWQYRIAAEVILLSYSSDPKDGLLWGKGVGIVTNATDNAPAITAYTLWLEKGVDPWEADTEADTESSVSPVEPISTEDTLLSTSEQQISTD